MAAYKDIISDPFFSPSMESEDAAAFPVRLRWGGSEDSDGISIPLAFSGDPHFAEVYFDEELAPLNLMMEIHGRWFYKAPGTKNVDLMSYFFEKSNAVKKPASFKLRYFLPPADGINYPTEKDDDLLYNYYAELPALPEILIQEKPVCTKITKLK